MKNKRILILSANTGGGHNSAAAAIREALESRGCSCTVADGLIFLSPIFNHLICKGHVFLYRKLPGLYGAGYRLAERLSPKRKQAPPKHINPKLLRYLEHGRFDCIICTHVFAAKMVSTLKQSGRIHIPCYFVATDYSCSPGVSHLGMDAWFIPHEKLIPAFAGKGIPEERIIPTGIPVLKEFAPVGFERAELRRKLGLPSDRKIVLISCGSMGADGMEQRIPVLLEGLCKDVLLVAACSGNRRLKQRLEKIKSDRLLVLGFVERLSDYMEAADLYLTKPGGLSTTEAIAKRVPVVLFNAVPGVETHNMVFLSGLGCAIASENNADLVKLSRRIPEDAAFASSITENCVREFAGNAAEHICNVILR